jgi:hypothetical protein
MQAMKSLMLKAVFASALLVVLVPVGAHATFTQDILHKACTHGATFSGCNGGQGIDTPGAGGNTFLQDLVNTFLFAAGLIAVIFLIIGGIRYITSTGDSQRIKAAKDTILYAIIGLIVTILALPIANYVVKTVGG